MLPYMAYMDPMGYCTKTKEQLHRFLIWGCGGGLVLGGNDLYGDSGVYETVDTLFTIIIRLIEDDPPPFFFATNGKG